MTDLGLIKQYLKSDNVYVMHDLASRVDLVNADFQAWCKNNHEDINIHPARLTDLFVSCGIKVEVCCGIYHYSGLSLRNYL